MAEEVSAVNLVGVQMQKDSMSREGEMATSPSFIKTLTPASIDTMTITEVIALLRNVNARLTYPDKMYAPREE